jgi:hypothetical protein
MRYLQKLPDSRRSPPGLERRILRKLQSAVLAGTFIPIACYAIAWLYPSPAVGDTPEKYLTGVGIAAVATVITAWTAAFTVAIGCVVVVLMKGPAYVADRYDLIDAAEPRRDPPDDADRPG